MKDPAGEHLRSLAIVCFLLLSASRALADSDGHFCTSDGYLAYELREWSAPEGKHVLRIVRVGGPQGIAAPVTVALADFQVHGMKCSPHDIAISSWDSTYSIALSADAPPEIRAVMPHRGGEISRDLPVTDRLTGSRRSFVVGIPASQSANTYELEVVHSEDKQTTPGKGGLIRHHTTSKVVEKDRTGRKRQEKLIHAGTSEETID